MLPARPDLVLDDARGKLFAAGCGGRPIVRRCNVDGTSCSGLVLDGGCSSSAVAFDARNDKLLLLTMAAFGAPVLLHRCAGDLSGCTTRVIAKTSQAGLGAVIEPTNGKLFVTLEAPGQSPSGPVVLVRCNVDGTGCTQRDLPGSGLAQPTIIRGELVMSLVRGPTPLLMRCTLDGASCSSRALTLGFDAGDYPGTSHVVYDVAHDMFLVSTQATGTDVPIVYTIGPLVIRQPRDGSAHHVHDVSAAPGKMPYAGVSLFDEASQKLYVLAESDIRGPSEDRRYHRILSRCNADGTDCTFADAQNMATLLGVVDGELLSLGVYRDHPFVPGTPENRPLELLRCNSSGKDCHRTVVYDNFGETGLSAVLDAEAHRALIVTVAPRDDRGEISDPRAHLYSCPVQANACTAPVPLPMSSISALAFDRDHRKLLASNSTLEDYRVTRCEPDGTSCTTVLSLPSAGDAILPTADALTVLTNRGDRIVVLRCSPEGSPCTSNDVSLDAPLISYSATHDTSTGDLLFVVISEARQRKLTLLRCRADGSACVEQDMSAGQPVGGIESPTAHFDATTRTALAVTRDVTTLRASLFALSLGELPSPTDAGTSPPDDAGREGGTGGAGPPSADGGGKTW